jgi:uncharacterized protein YwgA
MSDLVEQVAGLVRLNGQEMVGKTRLQKTVYLLEAKGLGFGIEFDYHKHGPYSAEVAFAAEDAEAIGLLRTEDRLGFYQIPYTVFHVTEQNASTLARCSDTRQRAGARCYGALLRPRPRASCNGGVS